MFSFIIPALNEEKYILNCLESIYRQADFGDSEVVVVDNGSTDNTISAVIGAYPEVKIIREITPGTNATRQRGFLESRGDVLIFLDADITLPGSGWLGRLKSILESNPGLVGVSTHFKYPEFPWYLKYIHAALVLAVIYPLIYVANNWLNIASHMVGGTMVIPRFALEAVGGFELSHKFYGDEAMIAKKLRKIGRVNLYPIIWTYASARRYQKQGLLHTTSNYVLNYFWVLFTNHPFDSDVYEEIR